jgi:hypothetical protein
VEDNFAISTSVDNGLRVFEIRLYSADALRFERFERGGIASLRGDIPPEGVESAGQCSAEETCCAGD